MYIQKVALYQLPQMERKGWITDLSTFFSSIWITSIPTVLMFKNGEKKGGVTGAVPKATFAAAIEKYIEAWREKSSNTCPLEIFSYNCHCLVCHDNVIPSFYIMRCSLIITCICWTIFLQISQISELKVKCIHDG